MNRGNCRLISFLLIVLFSFTATAQKAKSQKSGKGQKTTQKPAQKSTQKTVQKPAVKVVPDPTADEKKVRDLIAFFQFMLNTLGSKQTSTRDKDVMITESYSKIFRDGKVQIEDDLDTERKVITNKDVVAYLKDVDYFFNDVKFEFAIEQVKTDKQSNGEVYYEVVATRHITGVDADGKSVVNAQARHIEVNYSPENQELKIVSVYTNEFNEKEALTQWWNGLSYEWKEIFQKKLSLPDEPQLADIKKVTALQELDLSNNTYIQSLEPLAQLPDLRSLYLSRTTVSDLAPLRNLTELTLLDLSRSRAKDLTPLRYATQLKSFDASFTEVTDVSVLEKMPELEHLALQSLRISDFSFIELLANLHTLNLAETPLTKLLSFENLAQLSQLNLSATLVSDINDLSQLSELEMLDLDSTRIFNIESLSNLAQLKILRVNNTNVADLSPLQKLNNLTKIYCDQTKVKQTDLDAFARVNPKVLIVFDSKNLATWWNGLSPEWQTVFSKSIGLTPESFSKEELARIILLDSINISGTRIDNLEPLQRLSKIRVLIANRTSIANLSPIQSQMEIQFLDISETAVVDISALSRLKKLKIVMADKSKVEGVEKLTLPGLQKLFVDQTSVQDILAGQFLENNPNTLLVYKTFHLERWWTNLPEVWKEIFKDQLNKKTNLSREDLHRLVELQKVQFKDQPIVSLSALNQFIRLTDLHISGSALTSIALPENLFSLKSLHTTHSPLQKIDSLSLLVNLEDLDISNTPLDDIYDVWRLKNLKKLNCSGTQIKRLDALEKMESLESLDFSNTNVSKLGPLEYLPLKTLKCYNTKASTRSIENFKASHPDCSVMYYR